MAKLLNYSRKGKGHMMRCKACNSILSDYDMTKKRHTIDEEGHIFTEFEDLCGQCRGHIYATDDEAIEFIQYNEEEM